MNVFDFDKTIYDGDSTADFFRFCLRRQPGLSRFLPRIVWGFSLYFLGVWDKTRAKQNFYRFLRAVPDVDGCVSAFWESYLCRIKSWYPAMQRGDDVIISASPEFLLAPACRRLGIPVCMASRVDRHTGAYTGVNCHGEEKVRRFYERFPEGRIEAFYSDSLSDAPLARLADRACLVRGDALLPWPGQDHPA